VVYDGLVCVVCEKVCGVLEGVWGVRGCVGCVMSGLI